MRKTHGFAAASVLALLFALTGCSAKSDSSSSPSAPPNVPGQGNPAAPNAPVVAATPVVPEGTPAENGDQTATPPATQDQPDGAPAEAVAAETAVYDSMRAMMGDKLKDKINAEQGERLIELIKAQRAEDEKKYEAQGAALADVVIYTPVQKVLIAFGPAYLTWVETEHLEVVASTSIAREFVNLGEGLELTSDQHITTYQAWASADEAGLFFPGIIGEYAVRQIVASGVDLDDAVKTTLSKFVLTDPTSLARLVTSILSVIVQLNNATTELEVKAAYGDAVEAALSEIARFAGSLLLTDPNKFTSSFTEEFNRGNAQILGGLSASLQLSVSVMAKLTIGSLKTGFDTFKTEMTASYGAEIEFDSVGAIQSATENLSVVAAASYEHWDPRIVATAFVVELGWDWGLWDWLVNYDRCGAYVGRRLGYLYYNPWGIGGLSFRTCPEPVVLEPAPTSAISYFWGRTIFTTEGKLRGDFGGGPDGMAVAKNLCQSEADAAGLSGNYYPVISDTAYAAVERAQLFSYGEGMPFQFVPWDYDIVRNTNANPVINPNYPYFYAGLWGQVAYGMRQLFNFGDQPTFNAFNYDAQGREVADPIIWTGSGTQGSRVADRCGGDWTTAAPGQKGAVGDASIAKFAWTADRGDGSNPLLADCEEVHPIACISDQSLSVSYEVALLPPPPVIACDLANHSIQYIGGAPFCLLDLVYQPYDGEYVINYEYSDDPESPSYYMPTQTVAFQPDVSPDSATSCDEGFHRVKFGANPTVVCAPEAQVQNLVVLDELAAACPLGQPRLVVASADLEVSGKILTEIHCNE